MISRSLNSRDVFLFAVRRLNTVDEQHQLLPCAERLHADACKSAARVQSLECKVPARPADSAPTRSDMPRLKESVQVGQRQLPYSQLPFRAMGPE